MSELHRCQLVLSEILPTSSESCCFYGLSIPSLIWISWLQTKYWNAGSEFFFPSRIGQHGSLFDITIRISGRSKLLEPGLFCGKEPFEPTGTLVLICFDTMKQYIHDANNIKQLKGFEYLRSIGNNGTVWQCDSVTVRSIKLPKNTWQCDRASRPPCSFNQFIGAALRSSKLTKIAIGYSSPRFMKLFCKTMYHFVFFTNMTNIFMTRRVWSSFFNFLWVHPSLRSTRRGLGSPICRYKDTRKKRILIFAHVGPYL